MAAKKSSAGLESGPVAVVIRQGAGKKNASDSVWNTSLGGVFVEMQTPLPFGAEMQLEFSLPKAPKTIRCEGFVVWSTKDSPEKARLKTGIGVRLVNIGIAEMRHLAASVGRSLES